LGGPVVPVVCILFSSIPTLATNIKVKDNKPVSLMTTNHLKQRVETTLVTSYVSYISDNGQCPT
jgi:hypothetical protein